MPTYDLTRDDSIRIVRLMREINQSERDLAQNIHQQRAARRLYLVSCIIACLFAACMYVNHHYHMVR